MSLSLAGDGTITGVTSLPSFNVGKVLQAVTTTKTDTQTGSIGANLWVDITGLSATITPHSASNTILISVHLGLSSLLDGFGTSYPSFAVWDGTNYIGVGAAAGSRPRVNAFDSRYTTGALTGLGAASFMVSESAGSTSARTYTVRLYNIAASSKTYYINRTSTDTDSAVYPRASSTITVMEIAA